jgi:glucosylceramidase
MTNPKPNAGGASVAVTGVAVNPTTANIAVGGTTQLAAVFAPTNATDKTGTWVSSNTAVATVDSTGKVTGKTAGNTQITFTTTDGAKTASAAITVA